MSREITLEVERTWERRSEKSEKLVDSFNQDLVQINRLLLRYFREVAVSSGSN